jgi:CspA family cold shock protein
MLTGTVKMISERGFGFLKKDGGGPDVFVHASTVQEEHLIPWPLQVGARVSFEVATRGNGRQQACNVRLLDGSEALKDPKQREIDAAWEQYRAPVRMGDVMGDDA